VWQHPGVSENILSIAGLAKAYSNQILLEDLNFGMNCGDKVGLVGRNGAGKSTLLRLISGAEEADLGRISLRRGTRLSVLEQLPKLSAETILENLQEPFRALNATILAYEHAAAAQAPEAAELLEEIEQGGGWEWKHHIERAATELRLPPMDSKIAHLSGGQQKRVALARMILERPDLILLDEPTNHLDAETVEWLERWLAQTSASFLLVTHDRYFLDKVVERLAELRGGALRVYPGNYSDFVAARAVEEAQRAQSRHRRLKQLMAELEWAGRSPSARTGKAKARLERIESAKEQVQRLSQEMIVPEIRFGQPARKGKRILEVVDLHMAYEGGPQLIRGLSLALSRGERIGILGSNGCGKSTLLRLVAGDLRPKSGQLIRGKNTQVAWFDQQRSLLDPQKSVRKTLCPDGDMVFPEGRPVHMATWLERFGFSKAFHQRYVGSLSGGEQNRLALACFLLTQANVLLMDEPTNDLDIETLHLLEESLVRFSGCVLVVTHDRYFLDKIATAILAFEGEDKEGRVRLIQGNYSHYRQFQLQRLEAQREAREAPKQKKIRRESQARKALSWKEERELEGIEPRIEALEEEIAEQEMALADPEIWRRAEGVELQKALSRLKAELNALYERWELLLSKIES